MFPEQEVETDAHLLAEGREGRPSRSDAAGRPERTVDVGPRRNVDPGAEEPRRAAKGNPDVQWNQSILAEMIGEICVVMSPDNANAIAGIVLGAGGSLRSD
jgi:hypothetical protein